MLGGNPTDGALFGDFNPSERLTISIPRHIAQLPVYYPQIRGQHGSKYDDLTQETAWSFGYGLTYSKIQSESATIDKTTYGIKDEIIVTVRVFNSTRVMRWRWRKSPSRTW
jgi:beta-glucosidase